MIEDLELAYEKAFYKIESLEKSLEQEKYDLKIQKAYTSDLQDALRRFIGSHEEYCKCNICELAKESLAGQGPSIKYIDQKEKDANKTKKG